MGSADVRVCYINQIRSRHTVDGLTVLDIEAIVAVDLVIEALIGVVDLSDLIILIDHVPMIAG